MHHKCVTNDQKFPVMVRLERSALRDQPHL
jgi:hypothetical protein